MPYGIQNWDLASEGWDLWQWSRSQCFCDVRCPLDPSVRHLSRSINMIPMSTSILSVLVEKHVIYSEGEYFRGSLFWMLSILVKCHLGEY